LRKVTVHCEIRPKNRKRLTTRSRRTLSARQAAKRPEAENGPWPARPHTTLPVPGRHAARDGNRPTGPLVLSASRAPGRNLGLGQESLFPPGLKPGPVIVSHPSQSDGCARFLAEQNRARRPCTTLALILIFSAPTHTPQRATPLADERCSGRERTRGAALSPSPVCAPTVGWMHHRRVASMAPLRVHSHRRGDERRGSSPA
jgi:hypothetical protein